MHRNISKNSKQLNIDFKKINDAALQQSHHIITSLLPAGKQEGDEWVTLNPKRTDQSLGSFKINLSTGVWADFATDDKGGDLISLVAYLHNSNQISAAEFLSKMCGITVENFSNQITTNTKSKTWEPMIAPVGTPKPKFFHPEWGNPVDIYEYQNQTGVVISYMCRHEKNGAKQFFPHTFGCLNGAQPKWEWKAIPERRPLFCLPALLSQPDNVVIIAEGEKTVIAAQKIFGNNFCITTASFGARSPTKTDWAPLKGRDVIIWPDNDLPKEGMPFDKTAGQIFAHSVAKLALGAKAKSVRLVKLPVEKFPDGWDLADQIPDGFTIEDIKKLLQDAPLFVSNKIEEKNINKNADEFCGEFRISIRGIERWFESKKDSQDETKASGYYIFVSANIEVVGRVKALDGSGWGLYLNWKDDDAEEHSCILPFGDFQKREANAFLEYFANNGLAIARGKGKYLAEYLENKRFSELQKLISISVIGWTPDMDAIVLPDAIFGSDKYVFCGNRVHPFKKAGSLQLWRDTVAKYAVGNSRLTFVISMAFLPPLLKIMGHNGFGVNLYGNSKTGKTTLQYVAGSVWGGKKYFDTWRVTANGLEGRAAEHNDTFKGMDEIHLIEPQALDEASYFLSEGAGKTRAQQSGDVKKTKNWDIIYLSTGEKSSIQRLAEGNIKQKAGQKVRLLDIQAEVKDGYGVYENLHEFKSVPEISKHLKDNCAEAYGEAIRDFLGKLVIADKHIIKEQCEIFLKDFVDTLNKFGQEMFDADDQIKHVARCCALIGFAGSLATEWGVLPWPTESAKNESIVLFRDWLIEQNNTTKSFEENEIIDHLSTKLQLYYSNHFPDYDNAAQDDSYREIWGYTKSDGGIKIPVIDGGMQKFTEGGCKLFYVSNKAFENVIFKGFNKKHVLKILEMREVLIPYENAKTGKKEPSHSLQPRKIKMRFYVLNAQNLFVE